MLSPEAISALFDRGGLVKICGLRTPEHAAAAAAAGADLIGFIFAPARRRITPAVAHDCIAAARQVDTERTVVAVGVFVDAPVDEIDETVVAAGLDFGPVARRRAAAVSTGATRSRHQGAAL